MLNGFGKGKGDMKDLLTAAANTGSVLPMLLNETGEENEVVTETIICDSISGGADYQNNMPARLSLLREFADGTEYRAKYVQHSVTVEELDKFHALVGELITFEGVTHYIINAWEYDELKEAFDALKRKWGVDNGST